MTITKKLLEQHSLTYDECISLLQNRTDSHINEPIRAEALRLRRERFGNDVYLRGLIEMTNICKNDCFYCGIRKSNRNLTRYRMTKSEILSCCEYGYGLGFHTFVLQGGEDGYFTDEVLTDLVCEIKDRYPECALTLSLGERTFDSYRRLREAGADRYLLRHETANDEHYRSLHPDGMNLLSRIRCLYDLKRLGYQVGAGFMVGSPYQTVENLAEDLVFLQELKPEMVGIGPFIPHHDTRFSEFPAGDIDLTLFLLSVIRILFPDVLLPATTALGTLDPRGREKGMLAGANVVMPNLTPPDISGQYALYDHKLSTSGDRQQYLTKLSDSMEEYGFKLTYSRGDFKEYIR